VKPVDFGPGDRENVRLVAGPFDGRIGYRPHMPPYPDLLWVGDCRKPECPCQGTGLATSGLEVEEWERYRFDGEEECMSHRETWLVGIYVFATVDEGVRMSRQEIMVEETAITAFRRAVS
jgi:hypothetical protein